MKKKLFKWQQRNRSFRSRFYFQRLEKRLGQRKLILSRQKQKQHRPRNRLKTLKNKLQALFKPKNQKAQNCNRQLRSSQLLQRRSGKIGFRGLLRLCISLSYNFNEYLRISHKQGSSNEFDILSSDLFTTSFSFQRFHRFELHFHFREIYILYLVLFEFILLKFITDKFIMPHFLIFIFETSKMINSLPYLHICGSVVIDCSYWAFKRFATGRFCRSRCVF